MARWWTVALIAIGVALALAASPASAAPADAPPVGPLPKGPVTRIEVRHGLLYAIVLLRPATGLAWRVARRHDASVTRQLREGSSRATSSPSTGRGVRVTPPSSTR